jgi:hypothetical protein
VARSPRARTPAGTSTSCSSTSRRGTSACSWCVGSDCLYQFSMGTPKGPDIFSEVHMAPVETFGECYLMWFWTATGARAGRRDGPMGPRSSAHQPLSVTTPPSGFGPPKTSVSGARK